MLQAYHITKVQLGVLPGLSLAPQGEVFHMWELPGWENPGPEASLAH